MGDDEQESDVAEYEEYIEDPPGDLVISEDDDNDAAEATDWSARHPRAATREEEPGDESAEQASIREVPGQ
ncbi:MAG TPA: hypothetical protein VH372_09370 [Actinospica sp.]|jgi:hypothetical protein|nr:hypothetical protein [Actinospica sp.]